MDFSIWKTNRTHYLEILDKHSVEDLNKIPEGFKNNLAWNIGHAIAIQQVLIYKRSGLDMHISPDFYQRYKSGSIPERLITASEKMELKELLESTLQKTEEDFANGKFQTYQGLTTSTRFVLDSFQTAFQFNTYHEGLHLGYLLSIRKML